MTSFFLIGPMGSGKTSVGRQLARRLELPFYDCDKEIEARCGVDIPTIFEYEGEEGFRQREAAVLDELTQLPDIVLATGGGSVMREDNRTVLKERGYVILLSVELDEQLRRISLNDNRPLLRTPDPAATLRALREERLPFYQATADMQVSTNSNRMQNVVNRLLRQLEAEGLIDKKVLQKKSARKKSPAKKSTAKKSATRKQTPRQSSSRPHSPE